MIVVHWLTLYRISPILRDEENFLNEYIHSIHPLSKSQTLEIEKFHHPKLAQNHIKNFNTAENPNDSLILYRIIFYSSMKFIQKFQIQ